VDWVAGIVWIGWQLSRGLSGNLPMDWVADIRGIRTMATMKLCDYPVSDSQTCDRPICIEHARHIEPDTDYCPQHAPLVQEQR